MVRKQLRGRYQIAPKYTVKVLKADEDDTAGPVSAVLIYMGTKSSTGTNIDATCLYTPACKFYPA